MVQEKFVIIDSHSLVHRAYHALPPLISPKGILVNAVYGFMLVFLKILSELKPNYLLAVFDSSVPTFRHQQFKEYKIQRQKLSENFYFQIQLVKKILQVFKVALLEKEGYEADDLIGTVCTRAKEQNIKTIIVTGDLDTLQLVDEKTSVYTLRKGIQDDVLYDPAAVKKRYQLTPAQWVDFKALKGDSSDNIPGVRGVGEKTALRLLEKFSNIENLYQELAKNKSEDFISPRLRAILEKHQEQAFFSKYLVTIKKDIAIDFSWEAVKIRQPLIEKDVVPLLRELGFQSFLSRLFQKKENLRGEGENSLTEKESEKSIQRITEVSDFPSLLKRIKEEEIMGILLDFEGKKFSQRKIKGIGFVFSLFDGFYLQQELLAEFFRALKEIDFSSKIIITHQGKILYEETEKWGVFNKILFEDLEVLAWLVDSGKRDYSLSILGRTFLKRDILPVFNEELVVLLPLWQEIREKIEMFGLTEVWQKIERPLIPVLASIEKNGISLNQQLIKEINQKISLQLKNLEEKIYELAGEKFNINSSQQLQKILFEKLAIPTNGLAKTPTGKISTENRSLVKITNKHPIGGLLINYRELTKLKNSFLDVFLEFINPQTGRLHTIWKQTATTTGRLASESPNLQNIPLKSELGKEIRKAFRAEKGYQLVSFDYSQIELRLAAFLSQDPKMVQAFKEDRDIHLLTASLINNVPLNMVTEEMRNQAKALNFGILYGMGYRAFAENTGLTLEQAKRFCQEYFTDFAVLKNYLAFSVAQAKKNGYAETLFGRKRFLPLIGSSSRLGKEEERMALNMPIQGLAADIMKIAMIRIFDFLQENNLEKEARLLLQIHDELILEIKPEIIKEIIPQIKTIMQGVLSLGFPLKIEIEVGDDWGTLKDYK